MARGIPSNYEKGWVYYERLGKEGYEAEADAAQKYYNNITLPENTSDSGLGQQLINKGIKEKEKELAFLKEVFKVDAHLDTPSQYLTAINEIMNVGTIWKPAVQKIKDNLENRKNNKDQKFYVNTFYNVFIPIYKKNIASGINGLLEKQTFREKVLEDEAGAKQMLEKIYKNAYQGAFRLAAEKLSANMSNEDLKGIKQAIETLAGGVDRLRQVMAIPKSEELIKRLKTSYLKKNGGRRMKGGKVKAYGAQFSATTNKMRGDVSEEITALIYSLLQGKAKGDYQVSSSSTRISQFSTDVATIFTSTMTVDPAVIEQSIEKVYTLDKGTDILSLDKTFATAEIQNLYQNVQNMSNAEAFVVYDSVKNYALGNSFQNFGFHGTSYNYSSLITQLEQLNFTKARDIINKFNNTMNGAILEGKRKDVEEDISQALASNIAEFLYDDYKVIGNKDNRAIHMFTLSGIKVPLSFFLIASGEAIQAAEDEKRAASQWFDFHFSGSKKILYDESSKEEMAWGKQREDAIKNFKMSVSFLKNFETIVKTYL